MKISAARYVEFLENLVGKIRSVAVEKPAQSVTYIGLGLGALLLVFIALIMLGIGLFRLLVIGVGGTAAYAIIGGLFLLFGWFIWIRRTNKPEDQATEK